MAKKLLFIVNPKAGRRRPRDIFFTIFSIFSEAGYLICLRQTQGPGDAERIAREEAGEYDLVVCYGGDGKRPPYPLRPAAGGVYRRGQHQRLRRQPPFAPGPGHGGLVHRGRPGPPY